MLNVFRDRPYLLRLRLKTLAKFLTRSDKKPLLTSDYVVANSFLSVVVGRGTYGTPEIVGAFSEKLTIGSFVSIASGVKIIMVNHESTAVSTYPFRNVDWLKKEFRPIQYPDVHASSKGPVQIGNDVWLGNSAVILPGVSIGDGAVIGAQAVVNKSIPPYAVAVGNPAKVVKYRFDQHQIDSLLKIRWWDWDDDFLRAAESDFLLSTDEFISKYS